MENTFPPWLIEALDRDVPEHVRTRERERLVTAARAANVRLDELYLAESTVGFSSDSEPVGSGGAVEAAFRLLVREVQRLDAREVETE